MGEDVLFGELRSLLQEAPSEARWARLCEQLDLWPPEALEAVALPMCGIIWRGGLMRSSGRRRSAGSRSS